MGTSSKKFKVCRKMNPRFSLKSIKPEITFDNEYLIVAKDTKLLIYNINTGYCIAKCKVDFAIKQKTGYVKGFSLYGQGDKIIVGYKKGFIVIWDISQILKPGIENFVSLGHDIDDIVITPSKHAVLINRELRTIKWLDILNNFSVITEMQWEDIAEFKSKISCSDDSRHLAFITKRTVNVVDLNTKEHK